MIKVICKYYLKFPPLARKAVNYSISTIVSGIGVDYFSHNTENLLIECDVITKKMFV